MRWKLKKKNWSNLNSKKNNLSSKKNWVANQSNERNKKFRDWSRKKKQVAEKTFLHSKNFFGVAKKTFLRNKNFISVAKKLSWVKWPLRAIVESQQFLEYYSLIT